MDLSEYSHVHFIGIGGISMSGIAEILHMRGIKVSGSDAAASAMTERLSTLRIDIQIGHRAENISPNTGLVVYTAAVELDNPELVAAQALGIETIDRAQMLGILMSEYEYAICVAGTHGKTTTTSMVAEIFLAANTDPTISVGGILPSIGGNIRLGRSEYFIAEACEYRDSFLKFHSDVGVILNIGLDHVDYFKDLDQMTESFRKFAQNIRPGGSLVIHADIHAIAQGLDKHVLTFGNGGDLFAQDIEFDNNGCASFEPIYKGRVMPRLQLKVPGEHNVTNALAAITAAICLNVEENYIYRALENYGGTQRRFEISGSFNDVLVVDDYAHHPTEIKATLSAAKRRRHNKIWCVFQPHTYTRTRELLADISQAFAEADEVVVVDIYASREQDTGLIHSSEVAENISATGKSCRYIHGFGNVEKFLRSECMPRDMLITMGAGDVNLIAQALAAKGY